MIMNRIFLLLLICLLASGCERSTAPDSASVMLNIISGDRQEGLQNTLLPQPIVIGTTYANGDPVVGIPLMVSVSQGDGEIIHADSVTDANGRFEFQWGLGEDYVNRAEVSLLDDPEVTVSCQATASYLYAMPEQVNDGWDVGALDTSTNRFDPIFHAVDSIRMGSYEEIHSFLIIHQDRLKLETYFPGHDSNGNWVRFDRTTPHEVQSASKSFRSALIGIAIDKGFITEVNEPLFSFFPEYAHYNDDVKSRITLEHILTMSSGLYWTEWDYPFGDPNNTLSTMYSLPYSQWVDYILSQPIQYEPGTTWYYNTGASIMLNQIIINASGMSLNAFVSQYYSGPLESARLPGVGNPLGGLTLPRDMAKLGIVYLNDGKWKDTQIVSKTWVDESIVSRFQMDGDGAGYGYQWWIRTLSTDNGSYGVFYASGNGGQYIFVIKSLDLVIVFTGGNFGSLAMSRPFLIVEDFVLPSFE